MRKPPTPEQIQETQISYRAVLNQAIENLGTQHLVPQVLQAECNRLTSLTGTPALSSHVIARLLRQMGYSRFMCYAWAQQEASNG